MSRRTDSGGGVGSLEGIDEIVHNALAVAVAAAEGNGGGGGGGGGGEGGGGGGGEGINQPINQSQESSMALDQGLGETSDVMGGEPSQGGVASMGGFASNGHTHLLLT